MGLKRITGMIAILSLIVSCAPTIKREMDASFFKNDPSITSTDILEKVEERNRTIEDNPLWISRSYQRFFIKSLSEIKEEDFPTYRRYLDNGSLYIIVHPGYYTFFTSSTPLAPQNTISLENELDRLLERPSLSPKTTLIKSQEKALRDFLELASTAKKLVILILPGKYWKSPAYKFNGYQDEYKRYINEITNESESVIYLYSKKTNRGYLRKRDMRRLLRFLGSVNPQSILIGGGYLGRCVEDFYKRLEAYYSDKLYIVPELVVISSSDIGFFQASKMLRPDGRVDIEVLTRNIRENNIESQSIQPRLKNLSE